MSSHHAWLDRNIAERLTFSSFSADPDDARAAIVAKRPFQIVALPGYEVPEGLDKTSKDALWLDAAPAASMPVWDGFSACALFEIIYECFGFEPGQFSGRIGVLEKSSGKFLEDPRSDEALRLRPRRETDMDQNTYRRHVADLYAWSCAVSRDRSDAKRAATMRIYSEFFTSGDRRSTLEAEDSIRRKSFLEERDLPHRAPTEIPDLKRGPRRRPDDRGYTLGELVLSDGVRTAIFDRGLTISDISRVPMDRPGDLAVACLPKSLGPDGLVPGARQEMRDQRDEMITRAREIENDQEQHSDRPDPKPSTSAGISSGGDPEPQGWLSRLMRRADRGNRSDGF